MATLPTATSRDTIRAILDRAIRGAVPFRRSFVEVATATQDSPLGRLVGNHDGRGLDLYLLILAQASGGSFDVTHPGAVWARALELEGRAGRMAVSKTIARLIDHQLIARDRVGRRAHLTLLREDGSGQPYQHPGKTAEQYFKLPRAYWDDDWHARLTLSAKAALLIALSRPPDFFVQIESAPKKFAISADTLERGLSELQRHRLLASQLIAKTAPFAPAGYTLERHYRLQKPFSRSSHTRPSTTGAAPSPTAPGTP